MSETCIQKNRSLLSLSSFRDSSSSVHRKFYWHVLLTLTSLSVLCVVFPYIAVFAVDDGATNTIEVGALALFIIILTP